MNTTTRRPVLASGLGLLAGVLLPTGSGSSAAGGPFEIRMISDISGSTVYFDPIGVHVPVGQHIRWRCAANVHTTTAYHPRNMSHSLRIPERAEPWNSGYLLPGQTFDVTLAVEGVYDYFCLPHEMAGMVGRIIVGKPAGPGTLPFDYYLGQPNTSSWLPVPKLAQETFPSVAEVMAKRIIHGGTRSS